MRIGNTVGGNGERCGFLGGNDGQGEVALALLDAILEQFPGAVEVFGGTEETLVAHFDADIGRGTRGEAAVDFLIDFFHLLELR